MFYNPSLNDLIDKNEFSLQYVTIDDAIKLIKKLGKNTWLMKTDITDAFKLIPIKEYLWPYHGIHWNNEFYFFTRLVFGSRSSPKIFDQLSSTICWIVQNNYNIEHILHLLDDFLILEPEHANAKKTMDTIISIFEKLGIPLAPHKTVGPVTVIEYLGVILDSEKMEARLPREKILRILEIMNCYVKRKSVTKREILQLLGHMNFACRIIVPARSFVSHLITLSKSVKKLHHFVALNKGCRAELSMWSEFLQNWNGISFFLNDDIINSADLQLYTDATPTGFGGFFQNKWFQGTFPSEVQQEELSMAFCELYPIVMACVLWGHSWARKRILFHCDNLATVEIIKKGRSKIPSIMKLMRMLTLNSATHNFIIHAEHIKGVNNNIADSISRFQMNRFRTLAPYADIPVLPTKCLSPQEVLMS